MKAVTRILRAPASAVAVLRYCYRQRRGDDDTSRLEVVAWAGQVEAGALTGDALVDAPALTSRCPEGRKAVGHVVISAEADEAGIEGRLLQAGHAWARRYAPNRSYVIIAHRKDGDCPHPHAHVVYERYGPEGTVAHISRGALKEMSRMGFTDQFDAARLDGSPSPYKGAGQVYPRAKRLAAREVAELLRRGETWESLLRKKIISPGRVRDGEVVSIIYDGKRLRLATVERLLALDRVRMAKEIQQQAKRILRRGLGGIIAQFEDAALESATSPARRMTR